MSLALLPPEVLHFVCRYVSKLDHCDNSARSCRGLVLSCRYLNALASSYLYERISLDQFSIYFLLRSILKKPDLAARIKYASIRFGARSKCDALDLGKAYTLLRKATLLPKSCTRHLHPDNFEIISVLLIETLILQLSQAEDVSINMDDLRGDIRLFDERRWSLRSQLTPSKILPNIKELGIWLSQNFVEHKDIVRQAQSLITLTKPPKMYLDVPHGFQLSCTDLQLFEIKDLSISCQSMARFTFSKLLQSFSGLRIFDYEGGDGPMLHGSMIPGEVTVRFIIGCLQRLHSELEELSIHFYQRDDDLIYSRQTVLDLRSFSRLTKLSLDATAVLDASTSPMRPFGQKAKVSFIDKMPRTLRFLRLFRADDRVLEHMKAMARMKTSEFPDINEFDLEWWMGNTGEPLMRLDIECTVANIDLKYSICYG